ncbi:D-ribose pyranase [Pseudalkalibacillus caeni]|uniref:D-ribose pyranase n=1 Tax=Exobacillus caeni TaxID=2574798 RepID=A0A5R9F3X2_9BACL|nr:D-ribose pyranase [Pseudalkalibacillus caeni]TLS38392.1 D-ribose pyranase [Pseudalkalibacillus caeni]
MKKNGVLNSEIAAVLAGSGHTDSIVICDCGLPIPEGPKKIDLSVKVGSPSFLEVFKTILDDFQVEKVILAKEIKAFNTTILNEISDSFSDEEIQFVAHEQFKELTKNAKAVIRTGEATPYANIILHSGVIF